MFKVIINILILLFIFCLQEGLFAGLGWHWPLVAVAVAFMHLYHWPRRWLYTIVISVACEIYFLGLSGQLLGLMAVGYVCQSLFSLISHTHDRFYVIAVGVSAVVTGELVSRLSVELISNSIISNKFLVSEFFIMGTLQMIISTAVLLFIGKSFLSKQGYGQRKIY
jgi:hypothetical protein